MKVFGKKRLTAIFLTFLLALSFTACSGSNPPGINKSAEEDDNLQEADKSVQVGDRITLGKIDWLVLAVDGGKALLLSE